VSKGSLRHLRFGQSWLLPGLLVTAGLVRGAILVLGPTDIVYPDEIFQYTEQAHRLVYGAGVVPWEFAVGVRSWLLPILIAGPMKALSWIDGGPLLYIDALKALSAALSLLLVVAGFRIALRAAGPFWAGVTGLLCATWYGALFFASSFVGEALSAYLLLLAVMLVEEPAERDRPLLVGLLLGLAFCLRFHLVPAILLVAAWYSRTSWRARWLPLGAGALAAIVPVLGLLDTVTLGSPFQSVWLNFDFNVFRNVSGEFGRSPVYAYFVQLAWPDNLLTVPLVVLLFLVASRAPLLALSALVIVVAHSFVPHKEYRFVCYAVMATPILTGLGLATCASYVERYVGDVWPRVGGAIACALLVISSWFGWQDMRQRFPNDAVLAAFLAAHAAPDVCGLGVSGFHWAMSGGYTFFHRDAPLYFGYLTPATKVIWRDRLVEQYPGRYFLAHANAFNYVVARDTDRLPGYGPVSCFSSRLHGPSACLFERPGGCS